MYSSGERSLNIMFGNDWDEVLQQETEAEYFNNIRYALAAEYKTQTVYPPKEDLFSALKLTPYHRVKAVIIGQDPYHGAGQAHGLSFSVRPGVRVPPSLKNIYKELQADLGVPVPKHGSLIHWAEQGVLLLNAVLTVRESQPNSHQALGWQTFTDAVIRELNERNEPMVYMLWGSHAQKKGAFINRDKHLVLESTHPSPLAAHRGFLGSRPFSKANEFLVSKGIKPIDWTIPEN
ncbi:uracil-DNA glycosylase [Paenibacillus sp. RRE4]|uniref:uracil-DNA glycosylase n=1 Tax=Paenibacillus TaxID=44249 RepID=UPI0021B6D351|nr:MULTISPECIES: uracil-DNA glycosylase [Paenibacillus]MDT0123951.1 uracil-DNA glycosylase [Paenibacillus sp. RRE4]